MLVRAANIIVQRFRGVTRQADPYSLGHSVLRSRMPFQVPFATSKKKNTKISSQLNKSELNTNKSQDAQNQYSMKKGAEKRSKIFQDVEAPEVAPKEAKEIKEPKATKKVKKDDYANLSDIANQLRIDSIRVTDVTKTGHPTSCSSIADICAVLFFHEEGIHFHADNHAHFLNDRFVLSKGHAAPILYAALTHANVLTKEQFMSLRLKDSIIEGHPTPKIPFVDVATGSLGQGLGVAAGMAYSSKNIDKIDNRVFCILGDGEIAEGSVWEAANFSSHYKLNNLIAIVDVNRLGQSEPTMFEHDINNYHKKWEAFGWKSIKIDGHNYSQIIKALHDARASKDKPTVLLAKTMKGKGFGEKIENQLDWHGKSLGGDSEAVINHVKAQIKSENPVFKTNAPTGDAPNLAQAIITIKSNFEPNTKISTRKAYGNALLKAHELNPNVIGLDGDTKNSTFTITLKNKFPEAFVECFIAEQNMVSVGTGLSARNKIPFCATFGAFFARAADQIRIAGISHSNLKLAGSHSGCSIGEDGPSQMALEDLAFFRTIPQGIVLYPSDGVSTDRAVELAANYKGVVYIRTSRPDLPLLYANDTHFQLGKSKVIRSSTEDKILLIGGGVTTHEALGAADILKAEGVNARVLDVFSVKPVDVEGIVKNARQSKNLVLVVEDHYPEGGLYEMTTSAVVNSGIKVWRLSVERVPGSAKPEEQIAIHGIDKKSIVSKVKEILSSN